LYLARSVRSSASAAVRVDAGFLDTLGPGFDQRLGGLLPQRRLLRSQFVDFMTFLRLHLVDTGVFEFAPWFRRRGPAASVLQLLSIAFFWRSDIWLYLSLFITKTKVVT